MNNLYRYPDAEWSLPLLFHFEPVLGVLYRILENTNQPIPKINVYGVPSCLWSGGRPPSIYDKFDPKTLKKVFEYVKLMGSTPALTLTSTVLTKQDLLDPYCNMILDVALEAKAHFIVYDENLKDYIKSKDSNAYLVASVVKSFFKFQDPRNMKNYITDEETEYYNELLKDYDLVVVRPEYSKFFLGDNPTAINDISRVEVLINQPCLLYCPKEIEHQLSYEQIKLRPNANYRYDGCPLRQLSFEQIIDGKHTCPHTNETVNKLLSVGVKHLKVQGREHQASLTETFAMVCNQMIKQNGYDYYFYQHIGQKLEQEVTFFRSFLDRA